MCDVLFHMLLKKHNSSLNNEIALVRIHDVIVFSFKGYIPGLFGTSHGALQFMAYEELKRDYTKYKNMAPEQKLVSQQFLRAHVSHSMTHGCSPHLSPQMLYIYMYVCVLGVDIHPYNHVYPTFTEPTGIHHNGSPIQNICCGDDVPLPGGPGSTAGPAQQIQWRHRCHQTDLEVQGDFIQIHRCCIEIKVQIINL